MALAKIYALTFVKMSIQINLKNNTSLAAYLAIYTKLHVKDV